MKPKKYPCYCRKQPASLALLLLLGATAAFADSQTVPFNIPAQPLGSALTRFSTATGLQVLYEGDIAGSVQAPALKGNYTPEAALRQLTRNTGFSYRYSDAGTVTLVKNTAENQPSEEPQTGGEGQVMPKMTVEADAGYDSTDPYNKDYAATSASTATKTDTPLMETAANVQVLPKAVLDDLQAIKLDQTLQYVAGVTTGQGSGGLGDELFLRGFITDIQFRNGFRFNSAGGSVGTRQMANVERIEVLKGPSAVLYGQNGPGGMVNVVTKQPRATPYHSLQQQFGSFDLYRTSLDTTGPLTRDDTLLYRFNASFEDSGSFRELVDSERIFLAPIIKWNISPRTQATLEMEYRHDNLVYDPDRWPAINGRLIDIPRSRNLMERLPNTVEDILIGFNWSHQFNDDWAINHHFVADQLDTQKFYFMYTTGSTLTNGTLLDGRMLSNIPTQLNAYYTDLNLTGHFDTLGFKHTLLLGGDFYRWDQIFKNYSSVLLPPIDVYNPVHSGLTSLPQLTGKTDNGTDFYGLYAQDQIKLPYGFQVMGGLRYQSIHNTNVDTDLTGAVNSQTAYSASAVTPRVGLLWQARDWLSLYGNYVENFGASNGFGFGGKSLPPESAQGWETGVKTEFFDGRLTASLTYFDMTKQNVATTDPNPAHVCFGGPCSVATGEVRSRGPELDIRGEILPGWNAIVTYANLDTRVTQDNDPTKLGNRLFGVPRNMGSLWNTYDFQQEILRGFKIGAGVTVRDGTAAFPVRQDGFQTAGFATVDLLAAYSLKVAGSRITAQLNVNNLLDENYITYGGLNLGASNFTHIGTPRSFMGSIRVEF